MQWTYAVVRAEGCCSAWRGAFRRLARGGTTERLRKSWGWCKGERTRSRMQRAGDYVRPTLFTGLKASSSRLLGFSRKSVFGFGLSGNSSAGDTGASLLPISRSLSARLRARLLAHRFQSETTVLE